MQSSATSGAADILPRARIPNARAEEDSAAGPAEANAAPISDDLLRRLQLTELRIASQVADFCDKHGISYVLLGGSALGARRHGGFIPWDDDMDLGMLRKDFDRFLDVARNGGLPDSLYVQHWLDDPHMGVPFAKVRLNNTRVLEASSKETGGHKGISIDIFPFDNVPRGISRYAWEFQLKIWKRVLRHRTGYTIRELPALLRLADLPMRAVAHFVSAEGAKRKLNRLMKRYEDQPAEQVLAVGGAYDFTKDMLKTSWLSDRTRMPFEGHSFHCPTDIDGYLAHMYGDFMLLPPVEERQNKHKIVELRFDLGEEA